MPRKQRWLAAGAAAVIMIGTVLLLLFLRDRPKGLSPGTSDKDFSHATGNLPDFQAELAAAKAENEDAVAWLYIPGTEIDEAVYQAEDNQYYLRRDGNKRYSFAGSLFMDYRSSTGPLSANTVIYGHHIGSPMGAKDDPDGVKFGQLLRFADENFAQRTPYIWLTVGEETYAFQVFAVAYCEAYLTPVEYHHPEFSPEDWGTLMQELEARSLYQYPGETVYGERILTLSTCVYKYGSYSKNPNQRLIVVARLVEDGVGDWDTAGLRPNPSPKPPQF